MSREDAPNAPNFRIDIKTCHNCLYGQFVSGCDDYQCVAYDINFESTEFASQCRCDDWGYEDVRY